jgi:ABC-2 type transport system ATP-binding protein
MTHPAADPVLELEGLAKRYGTVEAVRGIELALERGEIYGFLGPNGAGKSTTIRCLLGLLTPTAGSIRVFGLDAARQGVAIRQRLAYVPGELRLPERLTATQFIASIGRLRGGFDPARRDLLAERLKVDLQRPMRELSSGNRRKVALVLAFLANAELLVLDEPTSGLDPLIQREFIDLLLEARDAGTTVFLSSHVLSEVQRVADRVGVLREGRLVASGTIDEFRGRARSHVEVFFEGPAPAADLMALPGLVDPRVVGPRFTATLSGPIGPLLSVLVRHKVASMLVEEPDLEEAFLDLYGGGQ